MEREFKTLGIVIGKRSVRDNDVILTLLTPDQGLMDIYAYGVRKSSRAVRASLFTEGTFSLSKKSENGKVTLLDVDTLSLHEEILTSIEKLGWASLWSEMVMKGRNTDPELYSLFSSSLDALEDEDSDRCAIYFLVHYLMYMGLLGSFESCPVCHKEYEDDEILGFSPEVGNPVCQGCDKMDGALILPPNARRYLKRVGECRLEEALALSISPEMGRRVSRYLMRTLRFSFPSHLNVLDSGLIM